MRPRTGPVLALLLTAAACGGGPGSPGPPPWPGRTLAVWLGPEGLDDLAVGELVHAGVDRFVVPLGTVSLAGGVPVLRPEGPSRVPEGAEVALALRLAPAGGKLDPGLAPALWSAVKGQWGGRRPAALEVELLAVPKGCAALLGRLAEVAGVPVVPVVAPSQLEDPLLPEVAQVTGRVTVVAAGNVGAWREGEAPLPPPWAPALAPLAAAGARLRVGIVLRPVADPALEGWGEDLGPLAEPGTAEPLTDSPLERSFRFRRDVSWSGREWPTGGTVALAWVDPAELHAAFREAERVVVPPLEGWDLMPLPPPAPALGTSREALLAYLRGDGPGPRPEVRLERSGLTVRITLANPTPFPTAVSRFGNWVQVHAGRGLALEDRGTFDAVVLGRLENGEFRRSEGTRLDAIRLHEVHLAPGEEITATVRVRSAQDRVGVEWRLLLGDGSEVAGGG